MQNNMRAGLLQPFHFHHYTYLLNPAVPKFEIAQSDVRGAAFGAATAVR